MSYRRILLGAAATLPLMAVAAQAQTMQPLTGLYIAGGGGFNWVQSADISAQGLLRSEFLVGGVNPSGKVSFDTGWVVVGSVGWGFGNGLRAEVEGNYRSNDVDRVSGFAPLGVFSSNGRQRSYGVMANVLYDFNLPSFGVSFPWIQPYIGAGLGYVWSEWSSVNAVSPAGLLVRADDTNGQFAFQGIAGAAFPIPRVPGLAITAEYRFLGTLTPRYDTTVASTRTGAVLASGRIEADNYNHSVLIGLRYAFNQPRPAPAPVAAAPAPARSFLVFFDFNRSDLTERARSIVTQAAEAARSQSVTRIEVAGHTDTVGSAQYNQGLSIRRANSVAAELVRHGVQREAIQIAGYGFSRPLVPTGPGVREPQNRRVEIVLR